MNRSVGRPQSIHLAARIGRRLLASHVIVLTFVVSVVLGGLVWGVAAADDPSVVPPLRFRKAFVPADQVEDWPRREQEKFVPVEGTKFDEMIAKLSHRVGEAVPRANFSRLELTGTWRDDTLSGTFAMETGALTAPRRITMGPADWLLSELRWSDRNTQPLVSFGADQSLSLHADRAGTVIGQWKVIGRRPVSGGLEFVLRFPAAPLKRLLLDLPAGWGVESDVGSLTDFPIDIARAGRWQLELGGHERIVLRLFRRDLIAQSRRLPLVRTTTSYEFTGRGINVGALWRLESHDEPIREVSLVLDPGLQLIGAQYGELPLDWALETERGSGSTRVVLRLPQPIQGVARPLRLDAVGSAIVDRTDALPRLHPIGLAWQEGNVTITVPEPFVIEQFEPIQCRQLRTSPLPEPLSGESIELQSFAPDATVRWRIGRTTTTLRVDQGTTVSLSPGSTTAQVVLVGRVDRGERFQLTAELASGWTIESVDSQPPERLSDWTVEPQGTSGSTRLAIRLRDPITPTEPVRLAIAARSVPRAAVDQLSSHEILPLSLPRRTVESHLLAVVTASSWRAVIEDNYELPRMARDSLTQPELELIPNAMGAQVVRLTEQASPWHLRLEPRRVPWRAQIEIDATSDDTTLRETYNIAAHDVLEPIEHLLVHFTHARIEAPQWRVRGQQSTEFRVRRLSAEQQTQLEVPIAGETWEVTFMRPPQGDFVLQAQRNTPFAAQSPVSLAWLPELNDQHGTLRIHAPAEVPLAIDNHRLEPALSAGSEGDAANLRQIYEYDPQRVLTGELGPAVMLRREPTAPALLGAVITRAESAWSIDASGGMQCAYRWFVHNQGRRQLSIALSDESQTIRLIRVAGRPVDVDQGEARIVVPIPADEEHLQVDLIVAMPSVTLSSYRVLTEPRIDVDLPILATHRTLSLPAGFHTLNEFRGTRNLFAVVASRWLGWFIRSSEHERFDPTARNSWGRLLGGAQSPLREQADNVLSQLGSLLIAHPSATSAELLSAWNDALAREGTTLWLPDRLPASALAEDYPTWMTPTARARRWLRSYGWVLVVTAERTALLDDLTAQRDRWSLIPLDGTTMYTLRADDVLGVADWSRWMAKHPELRLGQYTASNTYPGERVDSLTASQPFVMSPGSVYTLDHLPAGVPLTIIDSRWMSGGAIGCFLIMVSFLIGVLRNYRHWHLPCAVGCLSLALWIPDAFEVWAVAISSAVWCSALVRGLQALRVASNGAPSGFEISAHTTRWATALALIVGLCGLAKTAQGEPPASVSSVDNVAQVLIPVDDDNQSQGTYLVPDRFYAELRRRYQSMGSSADDWSITAARYRGEFSVDAETNALILDELRAVFKVQVTRAGAMLRLPLRFEPRDAEPLVGTFGGSEVPFTYDTIHKQWIGESPEAGDLELSLTLKPKITELNGWHRVEFGIPPLLDARFEARLPAGAPAVEIPTALGSWEPSADPRQSAIELGPTNRLDLNWPTQSTRPTTATLDIAELAWLRIRPGSVTAEMTLRVKVAAGTCRTVPLNVDPFWRLLPGKDDARIERVETRALDPERPDMPRELLIHLREPTTEPFTLKFTFLQVGASGIGVVRLPTLEATGARSTRRWMALSVDAALDHEFQAPDAVIVAVEDFVEQWGAGAALPQLVLDRSQTIGAVQVTTRPKEPQLDIEQRLTLQAERDGFAVHFDATLQVSNAVTFQLRLQVPATVVVHSVSVLEDGVQRVARWSRPMPDTVVVFLNGPASHELQLNLQGFCSVNSEGVAALPLPSFSQGNVSESIVQIWRSPAVLVSTAQTQGLEDVESPDRASERWRNVVQWRVNGSRPSAQLKIRANSARTNIVQLTTLRWDSRQWLADVELIASVEAGVLDQLRLETPRSWSGPFTLIPPLAYEVTDVLHQQHQLLTITPPEPISELFRLKLSGPLKLADAHSAAWAGARPLVDGTVERYLRLPRHWGSRSIGWDIEGLRRSPLPASLQQAVDESLYDTYRVTGQRIVAESRQLTEQGQSGKLALVDVHYAIDSDQQVGGVVRLHVDPANETQLPLELPTTWTLLQVNVAGRSQTPSIQAGRHGLVPLVGELPQVVELYFRAPLMQDAAGATQAELQIPQVPGWPVLHTIWNDSSSPSRWTTVASKAVNIEPHRLALLYWQTALALYESALSKSGIAPSGAGKLALVALWRRCESARVEVANCRARVEALGLTPFDSEEQLLLKQYQRLAVARDLNEVSIATETELKPLPSESELGGVARSMWIEGGSSSMKLQRSSTSDLVHRARLALGLILLVGVVAVRRLQLASHWAIDILPRAANVCGVLFGVVWWLWLSPSCVGWGIMALSVWLSMRSGLRTTTESLSSVVRLPIATR